MVRTIYNSSGCIETIIYDDVTQYNEEIDTVDKFKAAQIIYILPNGEMKYLKNRYGSKHIILNDEDKLKLFESLL